MSLHDKLIAERQVEVSQPPAPKVRRGRAPDGRNPRRPETKKEQIQAAAFVIGFFVVGTALMVLAMTGCGNDGSTGTTSTSRTSTTGTSTVSDGPTHEEFIAQLNRLCREGNAAAEKLNSSIENATDRATAVRLFERGVTLNDRWRERLLKLEVPSEDRAVFARYRRAVTRQDGLVERMAEALKAGNEEAVSSLIEIQKGVTRQRVTAAIDLGAARCGKP